MIARSPAPDRRRSARRALVALAVLAVAALVPASASGQGETTGEPPPEVPLWQRLPDPRVDPGLIQLPVDSSAYRGAVATWEKTLTDIDDAQRTITDSDARLAGLTAQRTDLRAQLDAAQVALTDALADLDFIDRSIDHLAVTRYMGGGPAVEAIDLIGSPTPADDVYDQAVAGQVADAQLDKRAQRLAVADHARADAAARTADLVAAGTAIVETQAVLDSTRARLVELQDDLPAREQAVRDRRMQALVADTDISLVVLDAYVKAARRIQADRPSCGMQWWMIAALGRIESRHGTIFGSQVRPDGRTSIRIIGIPLDGTNNTMRIADTDDGVLDGDTTYDRAVGPLQFIPETWAQFRRDGNGDGSRDPHNIYDAALGTGTYLCARSGSLRLDTTEGLRRAYFAYNRSTSYVDTAIDNGNSYATLALPSG
jgi:membrane-bound lytic murein transglycosylase B